MAQEPSSSSLLSHCITCRTKCCHKTRLTATAEEHDRIIAQKFPDHFGGVNIQSKGQHYILDFKDGACKYLGPTGMCSIEKDKPDVCRQYPLLPYYDFDARPPRLEYVAPDENCPAAQSLPEEFKAEAEKIIRRHLEKIDLSLHLHIVTAWENRHNPDILRAIGATVTEPPDGPR